MADMIVANAEYSPVNGTYIESGTEGGKPLYIHESNSNYLISWDPNVAWQIYDSVDYLFLYMSEDYEVATPDLCSDWLNYLESTPSALTVTAAGGGDPSGALRRTNMNAQMSNLTGGMHG